jgi:hypothetical protein
MCSEERPGLFMRLGLIPGMRQLCPRETCEHFEDHLRAEKLMLEDS